MKKAQKSLNRTNDFLKNDLRYFKLRPRHRTAGDFVADNSSDITSWSSNASMQYRKFNAEALVLRAIRGLSERKGSSVVAIKKYIINHYPYVDGKFTLPVIRKIIRKSLLKGKVTQSQGTNIDGLFKISAGEIRAEQQLEQFKHYKQCVKLREQQKLELEKRINKCRAKEEKKRKLCQQKLASQIKRQREVVNSGKMTKTGLTVKSAREMISFFQGQQKPTPPKFSPAKHMPTVTSTAALRLGAGTSKDFVQQRPQIVDYADAAFEVAKVISSEQLRHAIIKNAEKVPPLAAFDSLNSPSSTSRRMPIKYEKTIRTSTKAPGLTITLPSVYDAKYEMTQTSECLRMPELNGNKKLVADATVNFPSPSTAPTISESVAHTKVGGPGRNMRKGTKRFKGNVKANTTFKIAKVIR